jgi:Putative phage tail protein
MAQGLGDPMSKVLKIAGAIVGVVAIVASGGLGAGIAAAVTGALGVGASTLTLIATGLAVGSSLLAPRAKAPAVSSAATDRLVASINLRVGRAIVFGHTAMATDIRDQEYTGNQTYLHRFMVIASHRVQAVEQLWFDDKLAWTSSGGVQGEYAGYLTVVPVLEGGPGNAINISSRMGSSRRFTGLAYLHLRYKLTGNNKNSDSPFAQSIPTRMTVIGKAALIYDPRLDSMAGGSGSQRADDQSTWAWNDDAARNPALQLLWYLLGWRIRNPATGEWKLAVGKGIPPERIDIDSFITAANLCDEQVARAAGGTEPRYRSDGIFTESDDPTLVLDNLKAAMNADLDDMDGKLRITVLHNDLGTPQPGLTTADVLDAFKWTQTPPLTDSYNVIRGSYTDPSTTSLYQQVDYPEVRIDSPDGIDRVQTVNLPMVQSASQAQRLVKQRLQRALYGGMFEAVFQATAWRYRKGDVVPFTFAPLGWSNKLFRIVAMTIQVDGTVPMTLREEHPDIYLWDASDAPAVQGVAPTTYDHNLLPVVLDLTDLGGQASDAAAAAAQALDRIATLSDDGVLTGDEKAKVLLKEDSELSNEWNLLDTQAAGLASDSAVAAARATAATALTAWTTYRNALSPAWNNTALDTFIDRTVFRGKLTDLRYALDVLAAKIREVTAISGFNLLRNTEFEVNTWAAGIGGTGSFQAGYPEANSAYGYRYFRSKADLTAPFSSVYFFQEVPASPGQRYALQCGIEGQGIVDRQYLFAQFLDAEKNPLPVDNWWQTADDIAGPQTFNTKLRGFVMAPAGTAFIRFIPSVNSASATGAIDGLIIQPMLTTARADQTEFPPYSPGVTDGADGADGINSATIPIFQRAASAPALPSVNCTYDFAAKTLTGLNNGWTAFSVPAGTGPVWQSAATAAGAGATDIIPPSEWAGQVQITEQPATSAPVILYKRTADATPPALPTTTITYTFATKTATGMDNDWQQSLPATGGAYRWQTSATALATGATDTIAPSELSPARLLAQDGAAGADALSLSALPPSVTVPCTYGGTPKEALPSVQLKALKGTADVTATAAYTIEGSSGLSGLVVSSTGLVTIAGMVAEKAWFEASAVQGASASNVRVNFTKSLDGAPYSTAPTVYPGVPTTDTLQTVGTSSLLAGPEGTMAIDANGYFETTSGSTNVVGSLEISLNGGSSWTSLGTLTTYPSLPGEPGGWYIEVKVTGESIGLTTKQTVMVRLQMRKTNTNNISDGGGVLNVSWSG